MVRFPVPTLIRRTFTIQNAVSNGIWGLVYLGVYAAVGALIPVIVHVTTKLSWPWLALLGFGLFCLLWGTTLAFWARQSGADDAVQLVTATPPAVTRPAPLAEPDLAPAAIRELEQVRPGLATGTLAQDSAEVANALAKAYRAFHGTGVRVLHSPAKIPTDLPHDKFLERFDEGIERLREGSK
jgi:hypothetical protein